MAKQRILEIWQAALDAGHPEWVLLPYSQPDAEQARKDRFFNGRACSRGHVVPRTVPGGHCTACERTYQTQYAGVRRAAEINATPDWLTADDHSEIRGVYTKAARLTEATGIPHHVDHIVPLKHPLVCGLHIPKNLQVLTGTENVQKNNSFDGTLENEGWRGK
ncbi:HNH endonuclease signature motif containing protein [Paracoccus sp. SCSIO 75233]|uniref:HNH endonuclease signature motif containing protein n=1 Tax=Paracoccus sp. SCSIO 75233 TaxID=3017782 RepID=UPI0022F0DE5B|nr:HNH endonuclease signature motif containing protein [Paracoccus sp. SCSIO 75233]WBU54156.1 HNH endonuclease signature motif containing protein [Paracoccus sp. SCSIO 75233]